MLKILIAVIVGIAIGIGTISYINYKKNSVIEGKYITLQRDVMRLSKEIVLLTEKVDKQVITLLQYRNTTSIAKTQRSSLRNPNTSQSNEEYNLIRLEQEKIVAQENARNKHLGNSLRMN